MQDVAQRAGFTVRDRTQQFLKNLGPGQEVDVEIIENTGDVTPPPSVQQENTAPTQNTDIDDFKSAVEGKTFGSSGAVSRPEDIGDARLRSRRAYEPMIDALEKKNPGINTSSARRQMLLNAQKDVDYDIAYKEGIDQGLGDRDAVLRARVIAGFTGGGEPGKATPYRKFLQTVPLSTIRPGQITSENIADLGKTAPISEQITALVNKVKPGQIVRVEATDQSRPEEFGTWKNNVQASLNSSNADNQIIKGGATIGGPTLTDKHATTMANDNVLDNARAKTLIGPYQAAPIKGVTSTGLKTFIQDDNLRRMEPTAEAVRRLTTPKIEGGGSGGGPGGENGFGSSNDPNSPAGRLDRLEQSIAETKAISENLGRVGELLSQSSTGVPGSSSRSVLVPGTTRFDSARAAGYTTASGVTPRITNPRFQDKTTLGKTMENVMPKAGRLFFEQDSEGNIIPETLEIRGDRREIIRDPKGGGGRKSGETAGPPRSPLDTLIIQAQNPAATVTTTRPVFEEIDNTSNQSFGNPVDSAGLEQSPPDFGQPSVSGRSIGKYGVELGNIPQAKEFQVPTESPSSFTQAPGRAKGPVDIVVSGGRANNNEFDTRTGGGYEGFKTKMDNIIGQMRIPASKTINIISGGASGVDSYAAQYANEKREQGANFTSQIMKADWSKGGTLPPIAPGQKAVPDLPGKPGNYDPAAGGARNQKMINKAEAAIIFDGGSGTEDFTRRAEREQTTRRFPVYNASETGVPKTRFAGEGFDAARELQKIQTNQSVSPEQRRINAKNFLKNLETDAILRSIDYSDRPY